MVADRLCPLHMLKLPRKNGLSRFRMNLPQILFGSFTVVAMVPVLCLGTWVQQHALKAELKAVEDKHLLLAKNISGALSRYAIDLTATFEHATTPLTEPETALLAALNIRMVAVMQDDRPAFQMGDAGDLPAAGMSALAAEAATAFRELHRVSVSPIIFNQRHEPRLYLCRVAIDGTIVIAAVSPEYFQQVQKTIAFGKMGHVVIVDQTGQTIAHPKADWQKTAKNLVPLKPVQLMLARQTGVTQFYSPAVQMQMISGYAFVPETGWGVMVPQPLAELEENANQTRTIAFIVSAIGLLLAAGISWQLTQYVLAPIATLITAARQLAAGQSVGNLARQNRYLPGEIHELLQSFDQMATEVVQTRENLQEKVAERTQELVQEAAARQQLQQQLLQMATHDTLTGLPNRRLLTEQLQHTIDRLTRSTEAAAVLFIDLDGFKQVNDRYGHKVGDALLVEVAARLAAALRSSDSVFRWGGDEFVVLSESARDIPSAVMLGEKILSAIRVDFNVDGNQIAIGGSIGVRQIMNHLGELSVDQILADADTAMYAAKVRKNSVVAYGTADLIGK
jgi:diguanylate cyclase (GGDEF)-like protein